MKPVCDNCKAALAEYIETTAGASEEFNKNVAPHSKRFRDIIYACKPFCDLTCDICSAAFKEYKSALDKYNLIFVDATKDEFNRLVSKRSKCCGITPLVIGLRED